MMKNLSSFGSLLTIIFIWINSSLLSAAAAPLPISDGTFPNEMKVSGRTVYCSDITPTSHYPTPMYTCTNISVDGVKLHHGYADDQPQLCRNCPCGVEKGQPNDIHSLCKAMLLAHGVKEPLVAAFVVKPSCNNLSTEQKRIKYVLDEEGQPTWHIMPSLNGFINTLQCSTGAPEH